MKAIIFYKKTTPPGYRILSGIFIDNNNPAENLLENIPPEPEGDNIKSFQTIFSNIALIGHSLKPLLTHCC